MKENRTAQDMYALKRYNPGGRRSNRTNNRIIREALNANLEAGKYPAYQYELADLLQISEFKMMRLLRHELPLSEQEAIVKAIKEGR